VRNRKTGRRGTEKKGKRKAVWERRKAEREREREWEKMGVRDFRHFPQVDQGQMPDTKSIGKIYLKIDFNCTNFLDFLHFS